MLTKLKSKIITIVKTKMFNHCAVCNEAHLCLREYCGYEICNTLDCENIIREYIEEFMYEATLRKWY